MSSNDQKRIIKDDRDFISNAEFTPLNDVFLKSASQPEKNSQSSADLKAVYEVPVQVSAILGRANIPIKQILKLVPGSVIELDRKVGQSIDIYINNHLLARGNLVLIDDHFGITITEIIRTEKS
ncbi:MAG: flagellar motor switch protein FliN [Caedibacter sp. 38-128]|nr:flagellar motor switch protein FliN [Holosporales bacterium]OJX04110.1 MAG: flagellar motor switch protein FliN [Caedibacter sp. 38-128]